MTDTAIANLWMLLGITVAPILIFLLIEKFLPMDKDKE